MALRSAESRRAGGNRFSLRRFGSLLSDSAEIFIARNCPSRGAAIAFYAVTSIAPVLLIVIAIAGAVFGDEAARGAIFAQFRGLLGTNGADLLQSIIAGASNAPTSLAASILGFAMLVLAASGVFLELEDALNDIWEVKPDEKGISFSSMVRARLASLGLVLALGFLLLVSLVVDAGLKIVSDRFGTFAPSGAPLLIALNFATTLLLIALLFAAIYRLLPARPLAWTYVAFGAGVTAVLFQVGKLLIGLYLGGQGTASSLGAAGALLGLLLWVYYSAQIFLFGAALTRAHFDRSRARHEKPSIVPH